MLQLQQVGLAPTVTNTLDNEGEAEGFVEASKDEPKEKLFHAKRDSVIRLPKDNALNQMDWVRDSTSPSWIRFAACLSMQP